MEAGPERVAVRMFKKMGISSFHEQRGPTKESLPRRDKDA